MLLTQHRTLGGLEKKLLRHCNVTWQFMMANYEILAFIATMFD